MAVAAQLMLFDAPVQPVAPPPAFIESPPEPSPPAETSRRRSQAWLALHFGGLSLAAAYRTQAPDRLASLETEACAVIEDDRFKHVVACNEQAWKHGVRPGHRMNAAIAFCSSLTLISRDSRAEKHLLEHIATECLKYTSAVTLQPPNELLLEVRGSLRLFGGPAALVERVRADLTNLNAGLQVALAPTARSAQWLARASSAPCVCLPRQLADTLSSMPVTSLQWPLPVELQLARFGVTTLGDLMRLSRKGLARRIGTGPVRELQQAMGRTNWLHHGWSTPPSYHDRVLLDFEIETTSLLEKMLERPLARLKRTLIGANRSINELNLTLKHREGATTLAVRLQQPTADTAHLASLLHEHLDRLVLRGPVREVLLDAPKLLVASPSNHSLAMDPATRSDLPNASELRARLLDQLQSRLGDQAVRALSICCHHVPERAQCSGVPAQALPRVSIPPRLPRRPLWLLREPTLITREHQAGKYEIDSGPETIEAEAWEGASVRRAYYRARTREGTECWIYRDLESRDQWFIHGLFG